MSPLRNESSSGDSATLSYNALANIFCGEEKQPRNSLQISKDRRDMFVYLLHSWKKGRVLGIIHTRLIYASLL